MGNNDTEEILDLLTKVKAITNKLHAAVFFGAINLAMATYYLVEVIIVSIRCNGHDDSCTGGLGWLLFYFILPIAFIVFIIILSLIRGASDSLRDDIPKDYPIAIIQRKIAKLKFIAIFFGLSPIIFPLLFSFFLLFVN